MTDVHDALNMLDWIRDDWESDDEWRMAKKLHRLKGVLLELREPPLELHAELCRARIATNPEWRSILVQLRLIMAKSLRPRSSR